MEKRTAAKILTPRSEKELRRLRFMDPEEEQAFRTEYAEKSRRHLRVVMGLLLVLPSLGVVAELLRTPAAIGSLRFWVTAVLPLFIHLGGFLLTWSPLFPRFFQAYMALVCLIIGTTLIGSLPLPAESTRCSSPVSTPTRCFACGSSSPCSSTGA